MDTATLKPLFVLDALATGALLGALAGGALGPEDAMLRLYAVGAGGAALGLGAALAAALACTRLSEAGLRRGIRALVGVFVLVWLGAWAASLAAG